MKIFSDGTRVGESAEERRRLRQAAQDQLDEVWHRTYALRDFLDRTVVGDGYIATVVYEGACVVPGCRREARIFCEEHQDPASRSQVP